MDMATKPTGHFSSKGQIAVWTGMNEMDFVDLLNWLCADIHPGFVSQADSTLTLHDYTFTLLPFFNEIEK